MGIFFTYNSRGKEQAVYAARNELFDGFMDRYFPAPPSAEAPALASAPADARRIAGRYEGSRGVEHGFLTVLYLLGQSIISANPDGTISVPEPTGAMATYREIGPQLWRKAGGDQLLTLKEVDGVKTVIDGENPIMVLQEAPFARSAPVNLTVLVLSTLVLLGTLLVWPLGAALRSADRATSGAAPEQKRLRRIQRIAVAVAVAVAAVYLFAWFLLIKPVLSTDVGVYSYAIDWLVGVLEVCGLLAIGAAAAGVWAAWRMFRVDSSGIARFWSVVVALALLGVVWLGVVGQLITWNLNY